MQLLVGEVRLVDRRQTLSVPLRENPTEFRAGHRDTPGNDQGGFAQIDEPDLTAVFDAPPSAKFGRHTRLAPVGNFRVYESSHMAHCSNLNSTKHTLARSSAQPGQRVRATWPTSSGRFDF